MKKTAHIVVRRLLNVAKRIPVFRVFIKKLRQKIFSYVENQRSQQEIYDLQAFYPSIKAYYEQQVRSADVDGPLISILLPTYNTPETYLRDCIESILMQSYPKWELCIADDSSTNPRVVDVINEYMATDERIKLTVREKNGHISQCTNSALKLAVGDFVALMDHDDVLWPNALYEVVLAIQNNPGVDFIYSDEDKIDASGLVHSYPFLKPDFSPEFLESCNYITHFSCIRSTLLRRVGGFRKGYEGAQDWDLFIRISEETNNIVHIPKLLYSWRIHEASTASDTDAKPYVYEAQKRLLEDHVCRQGVKGLVKTGIIRQHRTIEYAPLPGTVLTIVVRVTSLDATEQFLRTVKSRDAGAPIKLIYYITESYEEQSVGGLHKKILGDNTEATFVLQKKNVFTDIAASCKDKFLAFVIDTTNIMSDCWSSLLLAEIQRPGVAFVGPVTLGVGDQTILSAGVGLGYGDGALDMLKGMPFDDQHYTRGLYAKSRRNVTALSGQIFAVPLNILKRFLDESSTAMMYRACRAGYRNIYTPYVQVYSASVPTPLPPPDLPSAFEDLMLNPNFKKDNPRMEVK